MSLIKGSFLGGEGYDIPNSGAFASEESDYLSRTPVSDGNRKIFTWSGWVKILQHSNRVLFSSGTTSSDRIALIINTNAELTFASVVGGTDRGRVTRLSVHRDTASYSHVLFTMDAANIVTADRVKIYVNGNQQDVNVVTTVSDVSHFVNTTVIHRLGSQSYSVDALLDGYMAENHFIDGQALTPDAFGELNPDTDQWVAKKYTGTYGTNGFYLNFQNASNLGEDSSGNGNDFANTGVIQSVDTPTNNHAILNSLIVDSDSNDSGLQHQGGAGVSIFNESTISIDNGKYYIEVYIDSQLYTSNKVGIVINSSLAIVNYRADGQKTVDGVTSAYGAIWTDGDIISFTIDHDSKEIEFFKNNVTQGTISYSAFAYGSVSVSIRDGNTTNSFISTVRFAEDSWTYSAPSGYKALSTKNLPAPEIIRPKDYFNTIIYDDGAGSKDVGFQPDLVWFKSRGSAFDHKLVDSVRGVQKSIESNTNAIEATDTTGLTSFDTNGFTIGSDTNYADTTGTGMVAWCFKKRVGFFDIVSYVGNQVGRNISHSLASVPELMIVKRLDVDGAGFFVYHKDNTATPAGEYLQLNTTNATASHTEIWNNTVPTSTAFSVGTSTGTNKISRNYIAYLFASVEGFSKVGSYTGNGSVDGTFVNCGFKPAFIMLKRSDGDGHWEIHDTTRDSSNPNTQRLFPNYTNNESFDEGIDILSNGFKIRTAHTSVNVSAASYVYLAIAEQNFKYSNAR